MSKIILPPYLKVSDSPAGVKQEHKYALRILSKSARFSETVLKLLSTFRKTNDTYHLIEEEINALFITLSASTHYLQAEYAKIVVKRSFDEETSRLFNNLENNTAAFNNQSLQNIRIAAELAVVSRPTPGVQLDLPTIRSTKGTGQQHLERQIPAKSLHLSRQPFNNSGYNNTNNGPGFQNYRD